MPKTTANRTDLRTRLRSRAGLVTAGVCASAVLATTGAAAASAAETPATESATLETFTSQTATSMASALRDQADGQTQAADAAQQADDAKRAASKSWTPPIKGDYALSASYAASGDRWSSTHSGQDFAVPSGTPVHAIHGGTVVKAGSWGAGDGPAYGNAVVIRHDSGTYSQYAHLSSVDVSVGQTVKTGERIASSGNTGNSTGPHLHFEIRTSAAYGTAVDPVKFMQSKDADL